MERFSGALTPQLVIMSDSRTVTCVLIDMGSCSADAYACQLRVLASVT